MKKIFTSITTLFIGLIIYSQSPQKINYQAVVRDGNGNILPNTSVPIVIDVLNGVNTCSVYSGSQTTNSYGLINIELDLSACTIDWSTGTATLSSSINSVSGNSDLNSVPYSIYSSISDSTANYPKSATDGDILVWSATNGKWEATTNSGGSSSSISDADGNTKVETEATTNDNIIHFETDGSERMVIDATGNIGIGNSAPVEKLDITAGNILLDNGQHYMGKTSSGTKIRLIGTWNNRIYIDGNNLSPGAHDIYFGGCQGCGAIDTRGILTASGNFIIGGAGQSPQAKLEVDGEARLSDATDMGTNDASLATKKYVDDNAGSSSTIWVKPNVSPFQTNDAITQNNDGNIGIGVIELQPELPVPYQDVYAPAEKLEVNGNIRINNIGSSAATTENSYLEIINDDQSTGTFSGITLTNNTSNMATASNSADNMFQIVHEKNSDGTINPLLSEDPQNEFKIRKDINYFNSSGAPATYEDFITIEGADTEIGIMTNNPHATLSVGGNSTGNGDANVAIGQNYAVFNPASPDNETANSIPVNSLIVEGKIGIGTMDPKAKLDIAGAARIGSSYAGDNSITDPTNGIIVEGTVGIGKNNPNTNYKLDVAGESMFTANNAAGGALKISNGLTQTSGDLVFISGTTGQNSLNVAVGNTNLGGELDVLSDVRINTDKFTISGTSGNTAIGGTLGVNGATTLSSTLDVSGATGIVGNFDINTNKFTVDATTGNTSIAGTLGILGASTLSNTLDVTGATTISSTLGVTGNTSIGGTLNMNSNLISNVTDPSSLQDAATKNYVDNSITSNSLTAGNDIDITGNEIILEDDIDLNHVRAATSSGLNLTDFSGNGIFIQNGGNVGIGVSNPRNIIDINGIGGLILDYFQSDIDQTQNCSGCTGHVALETSGTNPLNWETIYSTSNPSFQDGTNRLSVTVTVPSNGKIIIEAKTFLQTYNCSDCWAQIYGRIIDENSNVEGNSTQKLFDLTAFVHNSNGTNTSTYENRFEYNSYIEYEFLITDLTPGDTKTFTYQMAGKSSGTDIMRLYYSNEHKYTIKAITAP